MIEALELNLGASVCGLEYAGSSEEGGYEQERMENLRLLESYKL